MDFRRLLVATDGSAPAMNAVIAAGGLAVRLGAEVVVMTVLDEPGDGTIPEELQDLARAEHVQLTRYDLAMQSGRGVVDKAAAKLRDLGVAKVSTFVESGDPAGQVAEVARREKADLIVIGRRGLGRLGGLLLGSVSYKVVQVANVPCMVVG